MQMIISVVRYIVVLILAILATSYYLAISFVPVYEVVFPNELGGLGDIDFTGVAVVFLAMQFYLPFFAFVLGDKNRYRATTIILLILAVLDYQIDPQRFLILISFALLGSIAGWLVRMAATHILEKIPALEPLKKYF